MSKIYDASDEDQLKYSSTIRNNFPWAIPVVILPANKKLPELSKDKLLTKSETQVYKLFNIIRKYTKINEIQGIFLFLDNKVLNPNSTIGSLYREHHKNGILFMKYEIENVFGKNKK